MEYAGHGSTYAKHVGPSHGQNERLVTCIFNGTIDWKPEDGEERKMNSFKYSAASECHSHLYNLDLHDFLS
jgi:Rps23 Pro-64 3,4-dihydroxylase Tpa1-like proline 4-hydroxylase